MKNLTLKLITIYQQLTKNSKNCRFIPTCSDYSYQAISKYGILKGSLLSIRRIFKCHPWNKGGINLVP
ncbi:MAG: membrane protein insertion efficiency factor YidD [Patescibacteria group bacterium]|nr:membrane protein insertion efficiency factor YidD [Patescibacteria group bacterium]